MIHPYNAVGLIPNMWGIRRRQDMQKNLEHLHSLTKAACWLTNLDIPVRLVAIPEGALQGFNDEILDVDHADFAHNCAIDIPGPETEDLAKIRNCGLDLRGYTDVGGFGSAADAVRVERLGKLRNRFASVQRCNQSASFAEMA